MRPLGNAGRRSLLLVVDLAQAGLKLAGRGQARLGLGAEGAPCWRAPWAELQREAGAVAACRARVTGSAGWSSRAS